METNHDPHLSPEQNPSTSLPPSSWRNPFAPSAALAAFMAAVSFWASSRLPERVALRFDANGAPAEYGNATVVVWLLPGLYLLLIVMVPLLVRLSPRGFDLKQSRELIPRTNTAVGLLFASIHVGTLMNALAPGRFPIALPLKFGMGLFMIFMGNVIGRSERNYFIGFRTPWTLSSDANWRATHRFGGKVMILTGLWLLLSVTVTTPSLYFSVATIAFGMLIPVFYSLWYFQRHEKGREADVSSN